MEYAAPEQQPNNVEVVNDLDPQVMAEALTQARESVAVYESCGADAAVGQMHVEMAEYGTVMQDLYGSMDRQNELNAAEERLEQIVAEHTPVVEAFLANIQENATKEDFYVNLESYRGSRQLLDVAEENLPRIISERNGLSDHLRYLIDRSVKLAELCAQMAKLRETVVAYRMLPGYEQQQTPVNLEELNALITIPEAEVIEEVTYKRPTLNDFRVTVVAGEYSELTSSEGRA